MSLPAPFARGPSLSKKASQSFASADAKAIQFVFCRDMCVAENTLRGVSVELSAISGQLRRRAQRSFLEKVAKPLFRQSQPPLQGGHDMASVIARAACNASPDAPKPRFVSCLPCKGRWVGASRAGGISLDIVSHRGAGRFAYPPRHVSSLTCRGVLFLVSRYVYQIFIDILHIVRYTVHGESSRTTVREMQEM